MKTKYNTIDKQSKQITNLHIDKYTAQKVKFSIKDFFSKCENADLVTFTEEVLNGKLRFMCTDNVDRCINPERVFIGGWDVGRTCKHSK